MQFVTRVAVGSRPVHLYWVQETGQLWSHSDAEGTFYVISLANTDVVNQTVQVGLLLCGQAAETQTAMTSTWPCYLTHLVT